MRQLPVKARALVAVVVLCCAALSTYAVMQGMPSADARFAVLLALAVISARMKIRLPGFDSNVSMNLPFILTALVELNLPHAIVVGMVSTFVQCLPSPGQQMKLVQAAYNVCTLSNAIGLSFLFASHVARSTSLPEKPVLIVLGAAAFFLADTLPVAAIIAAVNNGPFWKLWSEMVLMTFPYFVLSAGVATIITTTDHFAGLAWSFALPVMFVVFLSFKRYLHGTQQPLAVRSAAAAD